jgi:hypothetical protein
MIAFVVFVALAGLTVTIAETAVHLPRPRDGERERVAGRQRQEQDPNLTNRRQSTADMGCARCSQHT